MEAVRCKLTKDGQLRGLSGQLSARDLEAVLAMAAEVRGVADDPEGGSSSPTGSPSESHVAAPGNPIDS